MELEQRVKTLEYEIKILKNEVQRTLLDIQEQILVHYYPSLRVEQTTPSAAMVQIVEDARARQAKEAPAAPPPAEAAPPPVPVAAPPPVEVAPPAAAPPAAPPQPVAVAPAVDPNAVVNVPGAAVPPPAVTDGAAVSGGVSAIRQAVVNAYSGGGMYQTTMVKLTEWASFATGKIGVDRVHQLLQACLQRGMVNSETHAILGRLLLLQKKTTLENVEVSDVMAVVLKLDETLGRAVEIDEVIAVIEEAHLG